MKAWHFIVAWVAGLAFTAGAWAAPYEVAIPLHQGKIELGDLSAAICREAHLPALPLGKGSIKVTGFTGSIFVQSLNAALGEGCQVRVEGNKLLLEIDPAKLPMSVPAAKAAVRRGVAAAFPDATARQRKYYGLFLPARLDDTQPIVILLHGLDDGRYTMEPIGDALAAKGFQVAYFVYPADGPIGDAAASLADRLGDVRADHPQMKIDLIGYSMGGLVARAYVEGKEYAGGVDHLIEIGTPNQGTQWTWLEPILAAHEYFEQSRFDRGWSPTWMITDGLGEATADMTPGSTFLRQLNKLPRRAGVHYTIIAGDQNPFLGIAGQLAGDAAAAVPGKNPISQLARLGLRAAGHQLAADSSVRDGPVSLQSAKLAGVTDFVVVHADHIALAEGSTGKPPAALGILEDRLSQSNSPQ